MQDLMTTISEAAEEVIRLRSLPDSAKEDLTVPILIEKLTPIFNKQNEVTDIEYFFNLIVAHLKYGFIGGVILK